MDEIELWVEDYVFHQLKSHAEKFPYYHANITVLDADNELINICLSIEGKGRNEIQQNLSLFLIDALKNYEKPNTTENI
jgi:hypothetical protein